MGLMDKLKFWKKDDFNDFDTDNISNQANQPIDSTSDNLGLEGNDPSLDNPDQQLGLGQDQNLDLPPDEYTDMQTDKKSSMSVPKSEKQMMDQNSGATMQSNDSRRDLELISSKLDTIKAELDSINQRVMKIEKIAEAKQSKQTKKSVW